VTLPSIEALRGASKSNASRALVDGTTKKLAAFVSRKLDAVDLVAMFIDGIEFAGHSVLIALGVTIDGTKTRSASGRGPRRTPPWSPSCCRIW
jgi:transposase-like protein